MATDDPRPLTRKELAEFLPSQRAIRAFEKLFDLVPQEFDSQVDLIEEVNITAQSGVSQAQLALDLINALASVAELITTAPPREESNVRTVDYVDYLMNGAVAAKRGRIWWDNDDDTINIGMDNGVVQQVGFENYVRGENNTGALIENGSVVSFDGAAADIRVEKFIADGTIPELYFIGVATTDIAIGDTAPVTTFGKVRGINTTGTPVGETWASGDILYASPSTDGALTHTRPTVPDYVVVVGIVLTVDATDGEILVKPQNPIGLSNASYTSTVDQTLSAANTATAVTFNTTESENQMSLASNTQITAGQPGLFVISLSLQITSQIGATVVAYAWLRKNGVDVPRTRLDFTIKANGDTKVLSTTYHLPMLENDYFEVMWASDNANVILDDIPATAFAPECPSAIVAVSQIQL